MSDLFLCANCEAENRAAIVELDRRLRCERCGSDAVESVEKLLARNRRLTLEKAGPKLLLVAR